MDEQWWRVPDYIRTRFDLQSLCCVDNSGEPLVIARQQIRKVTKTADDKGNFDVSNTNGRITAVIYRAVYGRYKKAGEETVTLPFETFHEIGRPETFLELKHYNTLEFKSRFLPK